MKPGDKVEEKVEKELYKQETGDFKFKLDGDYRNITFITNKQTGWENSRNYAFKRNYRSKLTLFSIKQ